MAASERTPLLSNNATAGTSYSSRNASRDVYLNEEANHLITHLKSPNNVPYPSSIEREAELSIYLYAIHLLDPHRYANGRSIRARIVDSEIGRKLREEIYDKVEDLLDSAFHEEDIHEEGDDDARLQEIFWRRWRVKKDSEKLISAIELMLPPFMQKGHPSPFLSHPTVRHILELSWSKGILPSCASLEKGDKHLLSRLHREIKRIVTPARLHLLDLISFLVLYGLTLSVVLSPKGRISPYPHDPPPEATRLSEKEIWWMILAGSNLVHSFQYPTPIIRRLLLLPIHLSFIFSLFPTYAQADYNLTLLSIPTMTFTLVLPEAPSLPILFQGLIPLSILLKRIITRSVKTAGLLMPLVLALFVLFSWSMNGDIFRGFHQLPPVSSQISIPSWVSLPNLDTPVGLQAIYNLSEPIEQGISPFQARLTVFITLSLLFVFSLLLTATRSILIPKDRWDGNTQRRWKGAIKEGDYWEKDYGLIVGREAREAVCKACKGYMWDDTSISRGYTSGKSSSRDMEDAHTHGNDLEESFDNDRTNQNGSTTKVTQSTDEALFLPLSNAPRIPTPLNLLVLPLHLSSLCPSKSLSRKVNHSSHIVSLAIMGLCCLPLYLFSRLADRPFTRG